MLCPSCRRLVSPRATACDACGALAGEDVVAYDLVLPGGARVALAGELTVGRGRGNTVRLSDPSVSRNHVRLRRERDRLALEDAGSSHGAVVDGRNVRRATLRDGSTIRLGDCALHVERRRTDADAGRTIIVRPGATVLVDRTGASAPNDAGAPAGYRNPRLRSGWALKRLAASEGSRRWVLKDLRKGSLLQLADADAALVGQLDGTHSVQQLLWKAERELGAAGPGRLAALLIELTDRGLLADAEPAAPPSRTWLAGRMRQRSWTWNRAGDFVDRLYRRGAWLLFSRAGWATGITIAIAGAAAFATVLADGSHRPLEVGGRLSVGAAVFVLGRGFIAALHELAHALTVASFGRRIGRAGLKLVLVFPYLFVEASDAWFEPRRRRLAVAAAGPACDLLAGAAFALAMPALHGSARDVAYQLALAAYVGALMNLNPLLDRDGCRLLSDLMREPDLRRRARVRVTRALAGHRDRDASRALLAYGVAALAWSLVVAAFAVAASQRIRPVLETHLPSPASWSVLGVAYVLVLLPAAVVVARPLLGRRKGARDA